MCGEENSSDFFTVTEKEIPPRVRRRDVIGRGAVALCGNTPACAGKSESALHQGHHALEIPPRVRGREMESTSSGRVYGNTPACAGKSEARYLCLIHNGKYPRVCGEDPEMLPQAPAVREIPPRVRGKGSVLGCVANSVGNTPACAGKRRNGTCRMGSKRKYPRVCGEEIVI